MDANTHSNIVKETAEGIRARFPHATPPKRTDAPEYDSVGRAVHYGTPTGAAGDTVQEVLESEFNTGFKAGPRRAHPDDPNLLLGGMFLDMSDDEIRAHLDATKIRFNQQLAENAELYEAWQKRYVAGDATIEEKPKFFNTRTFRSGDEKPIMLDHVDPYGRVIRCKTVSAARAEAERHDCTIKAGPGS